MIENRTITATLPGINHHIIQIYKENKPNYLAVALNIAKCRLKEVVAMH